MKRRRWITGCMLMASCGSAQFLPAKLLAAVSSDPETNFLPLFPLRIVVFPGETVSLHIFEPRYRQLIGESAESGMNFGIVTVVPGGASSIGTEMKLDRILRTDESGNLDVEVRGVRTIRLKSFQRDVEGKLYSGGQVTYTRNDPSVEPQIQDALVHLYNRLQVSTGSHHTIAAPYPENLSFLIGHGVGFTQAQELQLLTMPVERDRQAYIFQHLLQTK